MSSPVAESLPDTRANHDALMALANRVAAVLIRYADKHGYEHGLTLASHALAMAVAKGSLCWDETEAADRDAYFAAHAENVPHYRDRYLERDQSRIFDTAPTCSTGPAKTKDAVGIASEIAAAIKNYEPVYGVDATAQFAGNVLAMMAGNLMLNYSTNPEGLLSYYTNRQMR